MKKAWRGKCKERSYIKEPLLYCAYIVKAVGLKNQLMAVADNTDTIVHYFTVTVD